MRILFLDQFSELGGAQRCLLELFPAEGMPGWEVHAAVPGDGPMVRLLEERSVSVHRLSLASYALGRKGVADLWRFVRELPVVEAQIRSLVNRLEPAVIYVNGPRLMPAVARAARGCRIVFHSHNAPTARNGSWLVSRALKQAGASVIAASEHLASHWRRPARVIYGGVAGPPRGWSRLPPRAGPRVGLIGRFAPQKGQREFVTAAASLSRDFPNARFLLCGDALFGDSRAQSYKRDVLQNLPTNVRHIGWRDDVYEVLRDLDLLVVPSELEGGIPTVILEAFSAGVAVLATPVGGAAEIFRDGENGFLLASREVPTLSGRLRELLPRPDLLAGAASAAHREWQTRFTAEKFRTAVWDVIGDGGQAEACPPGRIRK